MNINSIKDKILSYKNKQVLVKADIGRKKYEYYEGTIDSVHPFLFTIKTASGIKAFSYSDVLIKNVIIKLI